MGLVASQITSLMIVYSSVYSDADQRKRQSSVSLAFMWGIHRGPVNSPHKWPVTRKMFPFDDVIMNHSSWHSTLFIYWFNQNTITVDSALYILSIRFTSAYFIIDIVTSNLVSIFCFLYSFCGNIFVWFGYILFYSLCCVWFFTHVALDYFPGPEVLVPYFTGEWVMVPETINKSVHDMHNRDVIMSALASQITGISMVCSIVCSGADQRKYQSSALVRGIHRWPANSQRANSSQRASSVENVSTWRHHGKNDQQQNHKILGMHFLTWISRTHKQATHCLPMSARYGRMYIDAMSIFRNTTYSGRELEKIVM